jgi:hypothetical protein
VGYYSFRCTPKRIKTHEIRSSALVAPPSRYDNETLWFTNTGRPKRSSIQTVDYDAKKARGDSRQRSVSAYAGEDAEKTTSVKTSAKGKGKRGMPFSGKVLQGENGKIAEVSAGAFV